MPTTDDFRREIEAQMKRAAMQGRPHIEVNAGELHRLLGGYPPTSGEYHAIPGCCDAMKQVFDKERDVVVFETESGKGAALTIRYALPRKTPPSSSTLNN